MLLSEVLDRQAEPDFERASSRKQQCASRHATAILTIGRLVFGRTQKTSALKLTSDVVKVQWMIYRFHDTSNFQ